MDTVKCPYCGHECYVEKEKYHIEDGEEYEIECGSCSKNFMFTATISIDYEALPALEQIGDE